jgi:hypothetical protein
MVIISVNTTTIIIICLEKFFILCFIVFVLFAGIAITIITIDRGITLFLFLFFVFSFDLNEAVYMNRVIIPDENVRMVTNATHLLMVVLNNIDAITSEVARIIIAIVSGFVLLLIFVAIATANIDIISLSPFDLQNQCSF